jgi:hypothetical protein
VQRNGADTVSPGPELHHPAMHGFGGLAWRA